MLRIHSLTMLVMLMASTVMAEMSTADRVGELMLGLKILSIPFLIVFVPVLILVIIVKAFKTSGQVVWAIKRSCDDPYKVTEEQKKENLLDALEDN